MLTTSTVLPARSVMTSPGLAALPEGIFSTAGITPITLTGSLISQSARINPKTATPPDLSYFILSMSLPGFKEIPPESNVTAFPTRATVREAF